MKEFCHPGMDPYLPRVVHVFFFRPHAINDRPVGLVFPNRSEGSTEVVEIQEGPRIEEGVMSSPGAAGLGGSP